MAARSSSVLVQAADASVAENESLLELLVAQTREARRQGIMLARKAEIDFLLRLAGESQIASAIAKAGAKDGDPALLVVSGERSDLAVLGGRVNGRRRIPKTDLTEEEWMRVEVAALLNAERS